MSNQRSAFLEKAWDIEKKEPTVWDAIDVKDKAFYYKNRSGKHIFKQF